MDDFKTHSQNFDFLNILLTGASFGVFSVVGSSWKDFLQVIVDQYFKSEEQTVFESFLNLLFINVTGGIFLALAFFTNRCIRRTKRSVQNRPYIPSAK